MSTVDPRRIAVIADLVWQRESQAGGFMAGDAQQIRALLAEWEGARHAQAQIAEDLRQQVTNQGFFLPREA